LEINPLNKKIINCLTLFIFPDTYIETIQ